MRPKKHVLDLFTKDDPWPLRLTVLVIWLTFLLVLAGLMTQLPASPLGALIKRFI